MLDLVIRNGTIVNGTGTPGFVGDIGVRAGRVTAVGRVEDDATREVDASGSVVCPGFVDTHTHYDAQLHWDRLLTPSSWYGITTAVMGNCGFALAPCKAGDRRFLLQTLQHVEGIEFRSSWPGLHDGEWGYESFPEFLDFVEHNNCALNLVTQIGHTALRTWVMGAEAATSRLATDEEITRMTEVLGEALEAGAAGLSTTGSPGHTGAGGVPVPSRWADEREFLALCATLAQARHGRLQGVGGTVLTNPFVLRLLEETGVVLAEITPTQLDRVRTELWDVGYQIYPQLQVIPGSIYIGLHDPSYFAINLPGGAFGVPQLNELFGPVVSMRTPEERLAFYQDPSFLPRFISDTDIDSWNSRYWPAILIVKAPTRPDWEGQSVADIAGATGLTGAEVLYEVCVASDLAGRFLIRFASQDPLLGLDSLRTFDEVGIGLHDAGAHLSQMCMGSWPARLLGRFVREGGLPIERAVQHATSLAAAQFGIVDRGLLLAGRPADIVVFNPATINDGPVQEVDDLPQGATRLISEPVGIDYVIVNGTVVREHNKDALEPDMPLPGVLLREFQPNRRRAPGPVPDWVRHEIDVEWDARVAASRERFGGDLPADPAQPGRFLV
jgi:N-acyl-D-amino-acid deacylase